MRYLMRLLVVTALLAPTVASACYTKDDAFVHIATFNVFKLGGVDGKYDRLRRGQPVADEIPERIKNVAKLIAFGRFDLITLQEVYEGKSGEAVAADLVEALKESHGLTYNAVLSDPIGRGLIPEAILFLFDPNRVSIKPSAPGKLTKVIRIHPVKTAGTVGVRASVSSLV